MAAIVLPNPNRTFSTLIVLVHTCGSDEIICCYCFRSHPLQRSYEPKREQAMRTKTAPLAEAVGPPRRGTPLGSFGAAAVETAPATPVMLRVRMQATAIAQA